MDGWTYLPRYIDKIRLHLAGRLHPDYQPNFGKGFGGLWLKAAAVTHEQMIEVVQNSITDGQVCDWVRQNVKESPTGKAAHREAILNRPAPDDAAGQARLQQRKAESGVCGPFWIAGHDNDRDPQENPAPPFSCKWKNALELPGNNG